MLFLRVLLMDGDFRKLLILIMNNGSTNSIDFYTPHLHSRIQDFARMFSSKLGLREEELQLSLWGDNYYNSKLKTIVPGAQEKAKKPLFVQVVLENLWSVYDSIVTRKDKVMTEKIVQNLQLKVTPRDLKHSDPKVQLQAVLSKWLPLSDAVLSKY